MIKSFPSLQVCFSDESVFSICEDSSQYVRRVANEEFSKQCVAQTVKHPTSAMVWSIMSAQGTGRLYRVSQEERTIIRESVPYVKLYRYNPKHQNPKLNG